MKAKASRSSLFGMMIVVAAFVATAVLAEPTPTPTPKSHAKTEGSSNSGSGPVERKPYKFGEGHTKDWQGANAARTADDKSNNSVANQAKGMMASDKKLHDSVVAAIRAKNTAKVQSLFARAGVHLCRRYR